VKYSGEVMVMNSIEKVYALLREQGGYLTTEKARKSGVDKNTLQRMAERGLIERVAHGLYIGTDVFPDPFFIAQHRCSKGVFSHETALFLHDLSDRNPLRLTMTIPSGWNTPLLTDESIRFFYSKPSKMEFGACEVNTPSGMPVRVYDVERTLCDCLRSIDTLDRDLVLVALKRYAKSDGRDNAKLLEYASALKIRDVVFRYLEVLA
jgi:predicted transcriptional regulator of viral defense system